MKKIILILTILTFSCKKENLVGIPNVITPNGDGLNDTWVIPIQNAKVYIYGISGNLIYQSDNYQNTFGGNGIDRTVYYVINDKYSGSLTIIY